MFSKLIISTLLVSFMLLGKNDCASSPCGTTPCRAGTTCKVIQAPNLYDCVPDPVPNCLAGCQNGEINLEKKKSWF